MQDRPVCFQCDGPIETNAEMVFEAPCGCDHHSSAVFHGICLFTWRERRKEIDERLRDMRRFFREHGFQIEEGEESE